jgi:hypothetical protein
MMAWRWLWFGLVWFGLVWMPQFLRRERSSLLHSLLGLPPSAIFREAEPKPFREHAEISVC